MSTRTLQEVRDDVHLAKSQSDSATLTLLLKELESFDSTESYNLAQYIQASVHELHGEYQSAISIMLELLSRYEESGDMKNVAMAKNHLGVLYMFIGDYANGLEKLYEALAIREEFGFRENVSGTLHNIAANFSRTGDYAKALEYFHKALELHIELGNRIFQANTLGSIGQVYGYMDNNTLALDYLQRALALHEELGSKGGESTALEVISSAHLRLGNYAEAERWVLRAIDNAVEHGLNRHLAGHISTLSILLVKMQRSDDALKLLDDNAVLLEHNPTELTITLVIRADIHRERGEYNDARALLLLALDQTSTRNQRAQMAEVCKKLRGIAKTQGDLDSYIKYNEQFLEISDEISGTEATRRVALQEKEREMEAQRIVQQREREERDRERAILYGALPQHIADRLIRGETVNDHFDNASVMFLDIAGFTRISSNVPPGHVVHLLESIFGACDEICQKYSITKIKTIGDSYMAMGMENGEGRMEKRSDSHVHRIAMAAIEIQEYLATMQVTMPPELGDTLWTNDVGDIYARVGLHCGPVVAGIVGKDRLQYDVWGDTVNIASRMESTGEPGRIQVSEQFAQALIPLSDKERGLGESSLKLEFRGETEVKGKGTMQTFWLERA